MYFAVNLFALVLLSFTTFKASECHRKGAPDSVCEDLLPRHETQPQSSKSPFILKGIPKNHSIELTIKSKDGSPFRGFAVQARPLNATSGAIGKFVVKGLESHTITCFGSTDNTITHSDPSDKLELTVEWIPPQDHENDIQIVFVGTVVKTHKQFWTNVVSETISFDSHHAIKGGSNEDHSHHSHSDVKSSEEVKNGSPLKFDYYLLISSFVLLLLRKV